MLDRIAASRWRVRGHFSRAESFTCFKTNTAAVKVGLPRSQLVASIKPVVEGNPRRRIDPIGPWRSVTELTSTVWTVVSTGCGGLGEERTGAVGR